MRRVLCLVSARFFVLRVRNGLYERVSKLGLMFYIEKSHTYLHRGYLHVSRFPTGDTCLSCEDERANLILRLAHMCQGVYSPAFNT